MILFIFTQLTFFNRGRIRIRNKYFWMDRMWGKSRSDLLSQCFWDINVYLHSTR